MEYLSTQEYEKIAKKVLIHSFPNVAKKIIRDNDKFGQIVSELMIADWKFDNRGSLEGYRKQRVSWILNKVLKKPKIRTVYLDDLKVQPELPDTTSQEAEFNDLYNNLCEKIKDGNKLSPKEQICIENYCVQRLDIDTIAESLNLNREAVRHTIKKALTKLGINNGRRIK